MAEIYVCDHRKECSYTGNKDCPYQFGINIEHCKEVEFYYPETDRRARKVDAGCKHDDDYPYRGICRYNTFVFLTLFHRDHARV